MQPFKTKNKEKKNTHTKDCHFCYGNCLLSVQNCHITLKRCYVGQGECQTGHQVKVLKRS